MSKTARKMGWAALVVAVALIAGCAGRTTTHSVTVAMDLQQAGCAGGQTTMESVQAIAAVAHAFA